MSSRSAPENRVAGATITTSSTTASSSFGLLEIFLGGSSSSSSDERTTSIRTPEAAWDFLTVKEFVNLQCVSKAYRTRLEKDFEYLYCRDGKDYTVPYPGFPGLLRHCDEIQETDANENENENANGNAVAFNDHNRAGLYPHQLASLRAMHGMEESNIRFGGLRGGVLGDAPGLGKTITTLALISSKAGKRPINPPEFWDASRTNEGWQDFRTNPMARTEILKCLKPVRNKLTSQQLNHLSPPFENNNNNNNNNHLADETRRFPTLKSFERYLKKLLRGDKSQERNDVRRWPIASSSEWELVRQNLLELRIGMDKRNRKLMSSRSGQRLLWERKLIRSSATLLVVPDALFEHWFQQIQEHLYLPMFADNDDTADEWFRWKEKEKEEHDNQRKNRRRQIARGVVYLDGLGDLADVTMGEKTLENTRNLNQRVLSAEQLSGYLIVIVTFSRCRNEVRLGHANKNDETGNINKSNNDKKNNNRRRAANTNGNNNNRKKRQRRQICAPALPQSKELLFIHRSPLLKLRWLRLMIDEGHQLETDNDLADFIHQVAAERRWVVSGTPVTGNEDNPDFNSVALDQLQRILYFLRHPKYGISKSEDVIEVWDREVKQPFLSRKSRENLLSVLKEIMVMHRKEDLKLPEPIFHQIEREVDIPPEVEAEITATAMNNGYNGNAYAMIPYALESYLQTPQFQSLVDDAQATYVVEAMKNARENLQKLGSNTNNSLDRRPIKGVVYSSSNKDLLSVADSILRKVNPENVAELYQNSMIGDMSAELERFRHGNKMYRTCPVCKGENGTISSHCDRDLMEVVSVHTGQRFLIEPERVLRTMNVPLVRLGGEPLRNYSVNRKFWAVNDELVVDIRESHPVLPKRESFALWKQWGAERCIELAKRDSYMGLDWFFGPLPQTESRDTNSGPIEMEVVLKKWQRCGVFHSRSRWYQGPKFLDSPASKRKEDVYLLCLDADLAHGLDLSFVTHIFLLEAINDAALLEQVTSRAHRLGATGPVTIETINVFYKCSEGFQQKVLSSLSSNEGGGESAGDKRKKNRNQELSLIQGNQNRKASLNKIVCHHCYRQFDSYALAEEHERTLCPRNPDNAFVVDKFHLSSVYKEIKPPLPMVSSSTMVLE